MQLQFATCLKVITLALVLAFPATGWSNTNTIEETPSALAMTGDAFFVRPVMMVVTVVGTAIFIVSSPFAALGGNIGESFEQLVEKPFETTFVRCLGCTVNGRKVSTTVKQVDQPKQEAE
tara:strand:- start:30141 stop:30500 length:360 start_codon:yes stop_codon:yes gene_type:complete